MLLYNKKLSSKDESNKSYHLSSRIPAGFGTVFHWKGCLSIGKVVVVSPGQSLRYS
jgi:hypothetical protein